jgi:hypothetical protein|uniref:hypothetical protein n=1 Tax=Cephaloticoccus sp. TaxID=1985742 RepID=UPI0040492300
MKLHILAALLIGTTAPLLLATPQIVIGDLKLQRANLADDTGDQVREYIPAGETLDHWNRLASVRILKKEKDSKKYLTRVADEVKQSNPAASSRFFQNDKKQTVLDFITFAPAESPVKYAEWNLMRAHYVKGSGLVVFQYALRLYRINADSINLIVAEREKMMGPFVEATFDEKDDGIIPSRPDLETNVERLAPEGWESPERKID